MSELDKTYMPREIEAKWVRLWEEEQPFRAAEKTEKQSFSIVIPPPNVTGILHVGHALNDTLQDIVVRWRRMQGKSTLWLPGTDHGNGDSLAMFRRRYRIAPRGCSLRPKSRRRRAVRGRAVPANRKLGRG